MRDKRVKLIYFSLRGSEVKDIDLGWKKVFLYFSMLSAILIILVALAISLFTDIYHDTRLSSLKKTNEVLKSQLGEMRQSIDVIEDKVKKLEANADEERMIAGLDQIDKETRNLGVGGPKAAILDYESDVLPRDLRKDVSETRSLIEQIERKIQLVEENKEEVEHKLETNSEGVKRLPTIRPVQGGRITDRFGTRIDPFTEKPRPHRGIDIAAKIGTPVLATAYGVVTKTVHSYLPNKNFGKYVEIDHGNGYVTMYAHLDEIYVRVGQKVKRWEEIGAVGNTGRSTGPHLHYEVRINEVAVNPLNHIY